MSSWKRVVGLSRLTLPFAWHCFRFNRRKERIDQSMTKTLEFISEVIRDPRHPFRQVDDRPDKPQKHRYERRKIKEYIKLADWMAESPA